MFCFLTCSQWSIKTVPWFTIEFSTTQARNQKTTLKWMLKSPWSALLASPLSEITMTNSRNSGMVNTQTFCFYSLILGRTPLKPATELNGLLVDIKDHLWITTILSPTLQFIPKIGSARSNQPCLVSLMHAKRALFFVNYFGLIRHSLTALPD